MELVTVSCPHPLIAQPPDPVSGVVESKMQFVTLDPLPIPR